MYKVEKNVLVATLQYLAKQPFAEVNELIVALQRSQEIVEPKVGEKEMASAAAKSASKVEEKEAPKAEKASSKK